MTVGALPPGHQFMSPEKPTHPALHLYPHIHGHVPLHAVPHLPRPLIHPTLYTAPPFTHSKVSWGKEGLEAHLSLRSYRSTYSNQQNRWTGTLYRTASTLDRKICKCFLLPLETVGILNLYSCKKIMKVIVLSEPTRMQRVSDDVGVAGHTQECPPHVASAHPAPILFSTGLLGPGPFLNVMGKIISIWHRP